jgi:hypothetical protein
MGAEDTSADEFGTQPGTGNTSTEESATGTEDKLGQRPDQAQERASGVGVQPSLARLHVPSTGPGGEGVTCIYVSVYDL